MPDENVTEGIRPDAPSADDALFGDAADKQDDTDAAATEEQDAGSNAEQDTRSTADIEEKPDDEAETDAVEELRVVLSIKAGRAVIGVQQPTSDPHIETFDDLDLPALAEEVASVAERARTKWEEAPKHPAYERPTPPVRRQRRGQQGAAQEATAETEPEQTQQQSLNLF